MAKRAVVMGAAWLILLAPAGACLADWVWDKDAGWVNLGEAPGGDLRTRFAHACALMADGGYAAALEQLQALERQRPPIPFAAKIRLHILDCAAHLARYEQATKLAVALIAEKPEGISLAQVWRLRFECAAAAAPAQPELAVRLLDEAAAEAPENLSAPAALWKAADTYARLGRYATAISRLEQLRAKYPNDPNAVPALRQIGEWRLQISMAQNAAGELPEQSAQAYAKYLELCPNAKDGPELQASITLLRRAAQENDPERRRVTYAMLLFERGQVAEAHAVFARAALPQKGNPTGEIAAYYQVLTLARLGELEKAFQAGEAFLRQYGASADYENALRAEFDVGVQLLLKDKEEGLKAMDAVFEHSPQGALADNALLEKGRYLLRHGEFIEAKRLFEDVLEKYPGRESCAEALFRLGQARLRQYNYHPERQAILAKAREAFELYLRQYPQGPFVPHAQRLVKQCREFEAEHLWTVAQFYLNRAEPDAAAVYMRAISTDYADTAAAEKARTWLKERGSNP